MKLWDAQTKQYVEVTATQLLDILAKQGALGKPKGTQMKPSRQHCRDCGWTGWVYNGKCKGCGSTRVGERRHEVAG